MSWPQPDRATEDPTPAFDRDGFATLGRVLDDDQLATARACLAEIEGTRGMKGGYACIVHDAWRVAPPLAAMIPEVGAAACAAIGVPELVLFHGHLVAKYPDGDDMGWHQDFSYLPLDRAGGVTLWIALDDATPANGCLFYLVGTHHLGERRVPWGLVGDDDPRASLPPIEVDPDEQGIAAPAAAGCAVAYHDFLWHRSPSNQTRWVRRAWVLSFVAPEALWSPRHSPHPRSAASPRYEGQPLEPDLLRARRA